MTRKSISNGLRYRVLRRFGFRCRYCGVGASDGHELHIDHVVPVAKGGTNDFDNLVAACFRCNSGKGVKSTEPDPSEVVVNVADPLGEASDSDAFLLASLLASEISRDWYTCLLMTTVAAILFDTSIAIEVADAIVTYNDRESRSDPESCFPSDIDPAAEPWFGENLSPEAQSLAEDVYEYDFDEWFLFTDRDPCDINLPWKTRSQS